MKIIKANEYEMLGVHKFIDSKYYLVFRNKYNDLEWIEKCKYISDNGKEVEFMHLDGDKLIRTPSFHSRLKGNKILSSELSQNVDLSYS